MGRARFSSSSELAPWKQKGTIIAEQLAWRIVYKKYARSPLCLNAFECKMLAPRRSGMPVLTFPASL
jgi:hypothetical protein